MIKELRRTVNDLDVVFEIEKQEKDLYKVVNIKLYIGGADVSQMPGFNSMPKIDMSQYADTIENIEKSLDIFVKMFEFMGKEFENATSSVKETATKKVDEKKDIIN